MKLPTPVAGAAGAARPNGSGPTPSAISIVELGEALASRGRERGFLSSDELLEGLSLGSLTPEQVEGFLTQVEGYLQQGGSRSSTRRWSSSSPTPRS